MFINKLGGVYKLHSILQIGGKYPIYVKNYSTILISELISELELIKDHANQTRCTSLHLRLTMPNAANDIYIVFNQKRNNKCRNSEDRLTYILLILVGWAMDL